MDLYAAAAGREVTEPAYWYAYGLLRLAVITQQLVLRRRDEGQRVPRAKLIVRWLLTARRKPAAAAGCDGRPRALRFIPIRTSHHE